jgi:hypothetical protein
MDTLTLAFLGVLLVYMVYSQWVRLDSRYLVVGALVLLVITGVVDVAGDTNPANVLAEYVLFLFNGGVVLLFVDYLRENRAPAPLAPADGDGVATPAGTDVGSTSSSGDSAKGESRFR